MTLLFRGADKQIVILKGGNTYDRNNFGFFFNSIQSVSIKIESNRSGSFEIHLAPSLEDSLKILQSGVLTSMTEFAKKPDQGSQTKKETAISPSFAQKEIDVSGAAGPISIWNTSSPVFLIKLLWPGDKLFDGNEAETAWFSGVAFNPEVQFDGRSFTFTVKGQALTDRISGVYGTNVYKNMSIIEILKDLDSTFNYIALDDRTETRLKEVKTSFAYNDNVKAAIDRLLYETNITYYTTSDTYYLTNRDSIYTSQPLYQFVAFRQIDPALNIFPILEFSSEGLNRLFTGGLALGAYPKSFDVKKKEPVGESRSFSDNQDIVTFVEKQGKQANLQGVPLSVTAYRDAHLLTGSEENQKTPQQKAVEHQSEQANQSFLIINLKTMGIPDIYPNCLVEVLIGDDTTGNGMPGVSGVGMVRSVTHEYSSEGWTTTLDVRIGASLGSSEYPNISHFDPDARTSAAVNYKKETAIKL